MKLTPDQLRTNAAAMLAFADGKRIEYFNSVDDGWQPTITLRRIDDLPHRPRPEPVSRPWDFNSRPREVVWVYKKGYITDRMITAWRDDGVEIGHYAKMSYEELFKDWLQRDGSTCGITD